MGIATPRQKMTVPKLAVGEHFIYPSAGYPIPFGAKNASGMLIDPANLYDPDEIYVAPTTGAIGGLNLSRGIDYNPFLQFRGFEVHGVQSGSVVMGMFANGSTFRYDNLTIASGAAHIEISGKIMIMIYCSANGTTASGVHPLF